MGPRLPGSAGLPIVGDKSFEFYQDPVKFVEKRIKEYGSRVFLTRILSKPTVIVAAHSSVKEVLQDENLTLGYKSFMGEIYGNNLLFVEGDDASSLRKSIAALFTSAKVSQMHSMIERCIKDYIPEIVSTSNPDGIYKRIKHLTTSLCLRLFLDVDTESANSISKDMENLTTEHWHGIISVPIAVKMPGFSKASTYSRALLAKEHLLQIIRKKLDIFNRHSSCNSATTCDCIAPSNHVISNLSTELGESAANHLLLFTSALVPKALASILSSFFLMTSRSPDLLKRMREDNSIIDYSLQETMRHYPPFFGGRRLVEQTTRLDGYTLPKGHAVIYCTYWAQRDESIFHNPEKFDVDRWIDSDLNADDLLSFGFGLRDCIGKHLVNDILKTTAQLILHGHKWSLTNGSEDFQTTYKWLPVSRPINEVRICYNCLHCEQLPDECTCPAA